MAISIDMSSKGCCPYGPVLGKLSRTYATQTEMHNAWQKRQGLVSIKELWVAFPYPPPQAA